MKRIISVIVLFSFMLSCVMPVQGYAQALSAVAFIPEPGVMVQPSAAFAPAILKGMKVYPKDPLRFDFLIDTGNSALVSDGLEKESSKLVRYFLAALTVPEKELWVNLSPYEGDRIIPERFGMTEMGRDLLAEDYILKQLTSSLMYPEKALGAEVWKRIYALAAAKYGTTDIPLDTFNKVWIVPDEAVVYVNGNTAFIAKSHLKVMLDADYLAARKNTPETVGQDEKDATRSLARSVIREIVLPELEKEVNGGANFSALRQIYHAMILSTWFKRNLKKSLVGEVYAEKNKVAGIDMDDQGAKEKIWSQYVEAFKKGVFNYIKEEKDETTQELIPRKYFSGGFGYASTNVREEPVSGKMMEDAAQSLVGVMNIVAVILRAKATIGNFMGRTTGFAFMAGLTLLTPQGDLLGQSADTTNAGALSQRRHEIETFSGVTFVARNAVELDDKMQFWDRAGIYNLLLHADVKMKLKLDVDGKKVNVYIVKKKSTVSDPNSVPGGVMFGDSVFIEVQVLADYILHEARSKVMYKDNPARNVVNEFITNRYRGRSDLDIVTNLLIEVINHEIFHETTNGNIFRRKVALQFRRYYTEKRFSMEMENGIAAETSGMLGQIIQNDDSVLSLVQISLYGWGFYSNIPPPRHIEAGTLVSRIMLTELGYEKYCYDRQFRESGTWTKRDQSLFKQTYLKGHFFLPGYAPWVIDFLGTVNSSDTKAAARKVYQKLYLHVPDVKIVLPAEFYDYVENVVKEAQFHFSEPVDKAESVNRDTFKADLLSFDPVDFSMGVRLQNILEKILPKGMRNSSKWGNDFFDRILREDGTLHNVQTEKSGNVLLRDLFEEYVRNRHKEIVKGVFGDGKALSDLWPLIEAAQPADAFTVISNWMIARSRLLASGGVAAEKELEAFTIDATHFVQLVLAGEMKGTKHVNYAKDHRAMLLLLYSGKWNCQAIANMTVVLMGLWGGEGCVSCRG